MMLGPPKVHECSSCKGQVSQPTYLSWNTIGSILWSDGKTVRPMGANDLALLKCEHCQSLVWIDELPIIYDPRDPDSSGHDNNFSEALPASNPTLHDYLNFLSQGVSDEQVHYVRIHAWWTGNDRRRQEGSFVDLSEPETDNLLTLVSLLDETNENERIMKAEGFRELGGFSIAQELLSTKFSKELTGIARFLLDLVKQKNKALVKV